MGEAGAQDPFESAWREVEANWAEDRAHRKFIAFCAAQGALAEAGRRYRNVRDSDGERAERAKRWSDAVMASAMEGLQLTRSAPGAPPATRLWRWVSFFTSVLLIMYGLLALLRGASQ